MHDAKELAGVGGERFDVPPLPFGVQRVERKSRFPRVRDARDDDKLVPGNRDADIFEIVLAGTLYDDVLHVWYGYRTLPVFKEVRIGVSESEGGILPE